jgi:hypothetical protein
MVESFIYTIEHPWDSTEKVVGRNVNDICGSLVRLHSLLKALLTSLNFPHNHFLGHSCILTPPPSRCSVPSNKDKENHRVFLESESIDAAIKAKASRDPLGRQEQYLGIDRFIINEPSQGINFDEKTRMIAREVIVGAVSPVSGALPQLCADIINALGYLNPE